MRLVPTRGVKQLVGGDMEDWNYGSDRSREEQHQQTPLDGDDDELAQENHVLRQENARLQQRLVEKMRGNSKILVSGGQFRSSVHPQKQAPAVLASSVGVHTTCTSCSSLRTSLKQLRQDHMHVQERTREYAQQLQRLETTQQAFEEAVDGRDREIYALESEIETQSARQGTLAAQIESLERNVMHLEALNESLTREIADFKAAKTLECAHKSVQCDVSESSESSREENLPFTDSDAVTRVENELLAVRSINQALIQETLALQKNIQLLENDKSALHEETRGWKTRSETVESQLSELENTRRAMESTMIAITQSRDELRQENEALQANQQRLQDALSARDQQLSRLARRMNESESESHRLRDTIEEKELHVVQMRKEVAEMATTLMDKTSNHATLTEELRCAITVSEEQATSMQKLQYELCRVQGEWQEKLKH
ncbi:hypothetical protein Poli38472_005078 [Pythium oligandrum]|uniref:Uncharacterized protein n=1 Tax=Pythium oligandrum TaxID=41045 RepID=A0A8K1FG77_PYTOL|nr:hypothetical protein Poli38472_005078 [Pythium oligandrum]|eukprot:TMW62460.1 hypothetical protein Poli38472_005078 [Pythium oligandrum]